MGLYNSLCNVFRFIDSISDKLFRQGCDFAGRMTNDDLGIDEAHGNEYQPVMGGFEKVLKPYNITEKDSILDIGCGKGKAMWIFSKYKFGRIGGYDISEHLVNTANANFKKINQGRCSAEVADALSFKEYDEYNYIFFNNSVPEFVFEPMIQNIIESVKRSPRKLVFIYGNQTCERFLYNNTDFKKTHVYKSFLHYLINYTPVRLFCDTSRSINYFTYTCYELDTSNPTPK